MSLPAHLRQLLPPATARAWEEVAPLAPSSAYLVGGTALAVHLAHRQSHDLDFYLSKPTDLVDLSRRLQRVGRFAVEVLTPDTLNGLFGETKLQFLLADTERILEPLREESGINVAGLGDLLATKLNAIVGRGALRDYFDLMAIETKGHRMVEEGLGLAFARYRPHVPGQMADAVVRALGYFGDVADDPGLPVPRREIETYWRRRQAEVVKHLARH